MNKLRKKLHSQSGASILLALLFCLVCMMVAASVLAAAVSNAGKIRSNYQEQQRYMALSSALRLVAGEIGQAKYYGRYTVSEWTETVTTGEKDVSGNPITVSCDYYRVRQEPGLFTCGSLAKLKADGTSDDDAVLTFRKELDGVFAGRFGGTGYPALTEVSPLPTNPSGGTARTRVLTVAVDGGEELFPPVVVDIDMNQNRRIHLTAKLATKKKADGKPDMDSGLYILEAELAPRLTTPAPPGGEPQVTAGGTPVIAYSPGNRMPKDVIPVPAGSLAVAATREELLSTDSFMSWTLDWVTKEIKEEAAP